MMSEFVDPGRFRTELALEAASLAPDGLGGHFESWFETAVVMARLEPVRADARFGAGQSLETVTHLVTTRWRADISSGMRFRLGARLFDIVTAYDPDETGRYLVCRTRETGR